MLYRIYSYDLAYLILKISMDLVILYVKSDLTHVITPIRHKPIMSVHPLLQFGPTFL
jgi:hypothetical protein